MPTAFELPEQRSVARLDLSPEHSGVFTPGIEAIEFTQSQLRRFNQLAQQLNPQMQALTSDQIAGVARRLLRTHAAGGESPFVRSRMRRAAELRAMRRDANWQSDVELSQRIDALLAYIDDTDGLFRNDVPVIGLLDDALLVDIALDSLRDELQEYADYQRHVLSEAARLDVAPAQLGVSREQWQAEREDEARLERYLRRNRESSFAGSSVMQRVFRVC